MTSRRNFIKSVGTMAVAAAVAPELFAGEFPGERGAKGSDSVRLRQSRIRLDGSWDVIVVGGGPGGCTAAIAAAREGAKVLLIEATGQLGGMGTAGMVPAWCPFSDGEKIIYRGLAKKIFNESKKGVPHEPAGKLDWVNINPEYLMKVYDRFVTESGTQVLFFSRVAAVEKSSDDTVDAIIVANQLGLTAYRAKVFVDATGNGDLAVWAGAGYLKSDTLQDSTLCFALANVNGDKFYGGLHSDNPKSPIHKVVGPDGKYPLTGHHFCMNLIGPNVVQFNAGHIHADTTDPRSVTEAMMTGRQIAQQYLEACQEACPDIFGNAFVVKTASLLGTRDGRRIIGDYIFTKEDWNARRTFEDEIGRNSYFLDVHKSGFKPVHYGKGDSHGIPYRCLTPKGLKNVLTAGRCISTDEEAFGSLRVMPPCLVTGEAAGAAAAFAIRDSRCDVHAVDVQALRARLRAEGQYFL